MTENAPAVTVTTEPPPDQGTPSHAPIRWSDAAGRWLQRHLPGLGVVAVGTAAGYGLNALVPAINPTSACVLLGCIAVNLRLIRPWAEPGVKYASRTILRFAVILLGLQLSLAQIAAIGLPGLAVVIAAVAATFTVTLLVGRALRIDFPTRLLIATGFSICGASAVGAMAPVARGRDRDTAVAVGLVTLCGSLAIIVLPLLAGPLGLTDPQVFGSWVGASVHDVGQTVATANRVPGALQSAVVIKLTRVVLLAPLVLGVGLVLRRRRATTEAAEETDKPAKRPPAVPVFVVGFIVAVVVATFVPIPAPLASAAKLVQEVGLAAALFGLGTGISWKVLRAAAGKPALLGLISWITIAGVAYAGVRLVG